MNEKKFLDLIEVAAIAHCSVRHVQEEIKRKNLRAFKPGKKLLFDPDDVQKWIKKKAAA